MTVAKERHDLKLGKGTAFDTSRLKRLRQEVVGRPISGLSPSR